MDPDACVYEPPQRSFIGAVLGKQWLGHFKCRAADEGPLQERCERRPKKGDSLEFWPIGTILAITSRLALLSPGTYGLYRNRVGIQILTLASN